MVRSGSFIDWRGFRTQKGNSTGGGHFVSWYAVSKLCPTLLQPHGACQAPLSLGQEYWRGLPFLSPGDFPNPGIEPMSPTWQVDSLPLSHQEARDRICPCPKSRDSLIPVALTWKTFPPSSSHWQIHSYWTRRLWYPVLAVDSAGSSGVRSDGSSF